MSTVPAELIAALADVAPGPAPGESEPLAMSRWLTASGDALLARGEAGLGARAEAAAQAITLSLADPRLVAAGGLAAAAPPFATLAPQYQQLFDSCAPTAAHAAEIKAIATKLVVGRPRYEAVEARTQVPWWFIGLIHALEARLSFFAHLHNGDPLSAPTVHVPKNRPPNWNPPGTWETSAIDALALEHFIGRTPWDLPHALFRLEAFNGFGYRPHHINTPYLWSFSQHYTIGKFASDGKFDPNLVSKQAGAAVVLKSLTTSGVVQL